MMMCRVYDDRMYRAQRQGKTSFYMKGTGEEAVSTAAGLALAVAAAAVRVVPLLLPASTALLGA